MAKDGAKKDGGKKGKMKIPKTLAGVKIDKGLRKAGNKALKLAKEPAVSEAVAAALLAAAAALRDPPATGRAAAAAGDAAGEAGKQALKIGDTFRSFAIDMARRTLDAWEKADRSERGARDGASGGEGGGGSKD